MKKTQTQLKPKKHKETFKKCHNLKIPPACAAKFDCARFNQCVRACTQSGVAALKGCNSSPRLHCMTRVCSQEPPVKSKLGGCKK